MNTDREGWDKFSVDRGFRPSTSSVGWSNLPTRVPLPSSRPREAGHGSSRSSHLNMLGQPPVNNLMNTSTVAPLKRGRPSLPSQQPSKKPRHNDQAINPRSTESFGRTAVDQNRPPVGGRPNIMPSATRSLKETPESDLVEMLSGTPSSPEPRSGSEDPMNLKDSPYRNTNSSGATFEARLTPPNAAKSRSNVGDGVRTQGAPIESSKPPRLDMHAVRKPNRVNLMKNRNGETSSEVKKRPLDFVGRDDPLSQSSMKHKQKYHALPPKSPKADLPSTTFDILEAFFGLEEQVGNPIGRLSMLDDRDAGKRLELKVRDKTFTIRKDDMAWLLCDENHMLYICVRMESDLFRRLIDAGILKPDSLAPAFPSRTLSLQFKHGTLGTGMVPTFLHEMLPSDRPPANCSSATAMWFLVDTQSRRMQTKNNRPMESAFSSADTVRRRASSPVTVRKPISRRSSSDLSSPPPSPVKGKTKPARRSLVSSQKQVEPLPLEVTTMRQTRKRNLVSNNFASRIIDDEVILIYPPKGPGGVQITQGEHYRLLPGEFLNDTLIEFGLRFWLDGLKESNPSLAEKIHVFSPFFYKKLKHRDIEAGYNAVRKWTSKVDIFKKQYLVIPINERLHWYLAIIMYPEHILRIPPPTASNQEPTPPIKTRAQDRLSSAEVIMDSPRTSKPSPSPSRVASPPRHSSEAREVEMALTFPENFDEQMDKMAEPVAPMEPESPKVPSPSSPGVLNDEILMADNESIASVPNEEWKTSQDSTWLLSFDSLGTKHPSVFIALRRYLALEAKHKKGIDVGELPKTQQAKVPSPVQPNYCDCGVYLIQTAETFLGRADDFFRQLMNDNDPLTPTHSLWEASAYGSKRQHLFDVIQALSNDWRISKGLPPKAAPEPTPTLSQASVVELVEEPKPELKKAPPIPHQESSDDDSIEITGEIRGKARLAKYRADLAARRRK